MARENQGHLIAIIILSLTSVVLGICTYLGFSGMAENREQRERAEASASAADKRINALTNFNNVLKQQIGFEGSPAANADLISNAKAAYPDIGTDIDKAQAEFVKDMAGQVAGEATENLTYRQLLKQYADALIISHGDRINKEKEKEKLSEEKQLADTAHAEAIKAKDTRIGELESQLAAEQKTYAENVQMLNTQLEEVKSEHNRVSGLLQNEKQARQADVTNLTNQIQSLDKDVAALRLEIKNLTKVNTDIADGQITMVSDSTNAVYINLGSADALKTKQRFVVYDRSETIFEKYLGKAFIEVTEIQGPHRAVARIVPQPEVEDVMDSINRDWRNGLLTSDEATNIRIQVLNKRKNINPVLTGDHIISDVWDPGYSVAVALIGNIDIDNDGISDLANVQSRIEQNGGKVVAKHDAAGTVTGAIDVTVRYIVIGDEPTDAAALKAYTDLLNDAKKHDIQQMSIRELYNALGFQGEFKVEHVGQRRSDQFMPRNPPIRPSQDSAYDGNR